MLRNLILMLAGHDRALRMEAESRRWVSQCEACGNMYSIWDVGGVRYKAKGNPKTGTRCPHCGKFGLRTLSYIEG